MWNSKLAVLVAAVVAVVFLAPEAGAAEAGHYPYVLPSDQAHPGFGEVGALPGEVVDLTTDGRFVLWVANPRFQTLNVTKLTDLLTGEVTQLSDWQRRGVAMSSNGRYVILQEWLPVAFPATHQRLYRLDLASGVQTLIADSVDLGIERFRYLDVSDDGSYVGFVNYLDTTNNFGGRRGLEIVRLRVSNGSSRRLSVAAPESIERFKLSGDGRFAVYSTEGLTSRVGVYDFVSGTNVTVVDTPRQQYPIPVAISTDGRYSITGAQLFDRVSGTSVQFASALDGLGSQQAAISDNGDVVAFSTTDALVANDSNGVTDIYTWVRSTGSYRRTSLSDLGTQLSSPSRVVELSGDGQTAVFGTVSSDASSSWFDGSSFAWLQMVVDLSSPPPADIGMIDASLRPGGGLWKVFRTGEVESDDAETFRDCNAGLSGGNTERPALLESEEVTSLSPTPSGDGYWLFSDRGRVMACGDALFFGDMSGVELAGEIVDSVATPSGLGYYMVGADGGVFAFGDAVYRGSVPEALPGVTLAGPVVAITTTETNRGYRMVAADGGMFNFGDAQYFGSVPEVLPGVVLSGPVVEMVASPRGYLVVGSDGGIFNFGESIFHGSLGGQSIPTPIGSVVVLEDLSGYVMFDFDTRDYPFGNGSSVL